MVKERRADTLQELSESVERLAYSVDADTLLRRACDSVRKRAILCIKNGGGHFEGEL
jgi:hypothetical protein